jgi:hypothetical protein
MMATTIYPVRLMSPPPVERVRHFGIAHNIIGRKSLSDMTAGVVKDWILIGLSVWMYQAPVSRVNIGGYLVAFFAVLWFVTRTHPTPCHQCT